MGSVAQGGGGGRRDIAAALGSMTRRMPGKVSPVITGRGGAGFPVADRRSDELAKLARDLEAGALYRLAEDHGAQLLLCGARGTGDGKRPVHERRGFYARRRNGREVAAHWRAGCSVGLVPWSLDFAVLDLDGVTAAEVERFQEALGHRAELCLPSVSGRGFHLFYRASRPFVGRAVRFERLDARAETPAAISAALERVVQGLGPNDGLQGDLRCERGYVVESGRSFVALERHGRASGDVVDLEPLQLSLPGWSATPAREVSAAEEWRVVSADTENAGEVDQLVFWRPLFRGGRWNGLLRRALRWYGLERNAALREARRMRPVLRFLQLQNAICCRSKLAGQADPLSGAEVRRLAGLVAAFMRSARAIGHSDEFLARQAAKGRSSGAVRASAVRDRDEAWAARVAAGESVRSIARSAGVEASTVSRAVRRVRGG